MSDQADNSFLRTIFIAGFIIAALYGYHRFSQHNRYENISRFDYLPNPKIDYLYYDRDMLRTYLENCQKLTDLGKTLWLRSEIDVTKTKKAFGEAQTLINQYQQVWQYNHILETRLIESKDLKEQGLTDQVIEVILNKGVTVGAVQEEQDKLAAYDFLKGKNAGARSGPAEIWQVQMLLNANDYPIHPTGQFDATTDSSLTDFQRMNNLYPSHVCDDITLKRLVE
ncbi:MAG: peptidoglycan-binding domain-containing protein [Chitinophagales bacterium]